MKDFFLITGNATVCDYSPSVQKRRAVGMKPAPHPAACEADPDVQDAACCAHSGG